MKITYAIATKPHFILLREVEEDDGTVRSSEIGEFDTEEEAKTFACNMKSLDEEPGRNYGKRWLGLEAVEI